MRRRWSAERLLIVKAIVLCGGTSADAAQHLKISKKAASNAARRLGLSFGRGCPVATTGRLDQTQLMTG